MVYEGIKVREYLSGRPTRFRQDNPRHTIAIIHHAPRHDREPAEELGFIAAVAREKGAAMGDCF